MSVKALLLSGGYGERLSPLTKIWPKCLMPIKGTPLLELWIDKLLELNVNDILVNVHYLSQEVIEFLERDRFKNCISWSYEENLLGTAGTLLANREFFRGSEILLAHADNFCTADMNEFYKFHKERDNNSLMTMMTFKSKNPENCGIVLNDKKNILTGFYEKVPDPPSNHANGAVYLLGLEFLEWLEKQDHVSDFSTEVIPLLIGKIQLWKNQNYHVDIGTIENLVSVQDLVKQLPKKDYEQKDNWSINFLDHPIHELLKKHISDAGKA